MTIVLTQSATAVATGIRASFAASGGTEPYAFVVFAGGAGGSINQTTGVYVAPAALSVNPKLGYDTIQVSDAHAVTARARILVGSPLILFCDIIQNQMGLANDRVYIFDQKIAQPSDAGLYVAVSVLNCKPFGNNVTFDSAGNSIGSISMAATLGIDVISRDTSALLRKEEALIALNSVYSKQQQDANSFYVAPLSTHFINLSQVDGAAIPYRFHIDVNVMYSVSKTAPSAYFDTIDFSTASDP